MRWQRKIGIGIILAGVAPLVYAMVLDYSHNWEPLTVRVTLTPSEFRSPAFKTDRNGRYLIGLAFDQLQDLTREQCMMGFGPSGCDGVNQTLDFDWQVISESGAVMQQGSYEPLGYSGVETDFAQFQAERRGHQRVVLIIKRDAGDLNRAKPRLVVRPGGNIGRECRSYTVFPSSGLSMFAAWELCGCFCQSASRLFVDVRTLLYDPCGALGSRRLAVALSLRNE